MVSWSLCFKVICLNPCVNDQPSYDWPTLCEQAHPTLSTRAHHGEKWAKWDTRVTLQKVDESWWFSLPWWKNSTKAVYRLNLTCTCRFNLWKFRIEWRKTICLCFWKPFHVSDVCASARRQTKKNDATYQQTNLKNSKLNSCCHAQLFSLCDSMSQCWSRVCMLYINTRLWFLQHCCCWSHHLYAKTCWQ